MCERQTIGYIKMLGHFLDMFAAAQKVFIHPNQVCVVSEPDQTISTALSRHNNSNSTKNKT